MDTVRDSTMGLPMPSHETVLDTLVPTRADSPAWTLEDTQGHSDSDASTRQGSRRGRSADTSRQSGSHHAETSSRGHHGSSHGQSGSTQEEDNNPSMSSHLTKTDTRALDVDHQLLGPAQPDIGDP
ncbi:hypothetical protein QTO34_011197 [Cnephaeus nilssonii]|uniref:Uncharacterized protein n=1 Tax=Cnephaeus nilssonii TaxID=3371016 RepID=A0AA40LD62_CNENI|nr:hypothetical protein QTO34_011197 [Eptesicus nilssonii]